MSTADQQLAALADVGTLLDRAGYAHWLFGGWAVDFHVGAITREHFDIDLAVWSDDVPAIVTLLEAEGWRHAPLPDEDGGTGYERGGVRVELTFLVDGEGTVFITLRSGNVVFSRIPLGNEVRELNGVRARIVGLSFLRDGKSRPRDDPEDAPIDRADSEALARVGQA
ncbi:MAG: nucleotidyltransferase domain-containing protein [Chloroflexota bacterium]